MVYWLNGTMTRQEIRENYKERIKCSNCGGKKHKRSLLCRDCSCKSRRTSNSKTLGDYLDKDGYSTSKCSQIRSDARRVILESDVIKTCYCCKDKEFDDIVEVHHIKEIMQHDRNSFIIDINNINNLVWLCPNHHTMIEKEMIKLK